MADVGSRPMGRALLPAPDPQKKIEAYAEGAYLWPGAEGTARTQPLPYMEPEIGLWLSRYISWRDPFTEEIVPQVKRYWRLYRNHYDGTNPGPNQDWRDDTVVPEAAKIIFTRTPRFIMAQYGGREWATCESDDPNYEEMIRQLLYKSFSQIGQGSRTSSFIERQIEAMIYCQVMGHVWKSLTWRLDQRPMRTKLPIAFDADGKPTKWENVEAIDTVYEGLDFNWLPLDSLAVNLRGPRRWAIERVVVSLTDLVNENESYYKQFGEYLYQPKKLDELVATSMLDVQDPYSEPRDTEGWPTFNSRSDEFGIGPGETPVELWLCWDNTRRTLTKIARRKMVLAHGLAPTPDGMDPYWPVKAVIVPGRVYGDSILNWIGPLCKLQTRIKRARADEVLLNIWQQFVYRIGTITSPRLFMRPGGAMGLQLPPNEPLTNAFTVLPRRPVFQEAYTEESYVQQQIESTAGADAVSQGVEATQKSRDVTKFEVEQRVLQGSARYQVENLYQEVSDKDVMLERAVGLLRQNLTKPVMIQLPGEPEGREVTLLDLQQPVNFRVGGGIYELSKSERRQDTAELVALAQNPAFGQRLKTDEILLEFFRSREWPRPRRFVKSEEEMMQDALKQMAMAQMAQGPAGQPEAGMGPEAPMGPPNGAPMPPMPAQSAPPAGGEPGLGPPAGGPGPMEEEL